jgi:predicted acetyltransferase
VERDSRRAQTSAHSAQSSGGDGGHRSGSDTTGMEIRPVTADELEPFLHTSEGAFHEDVHPEDLELFAELFEPERSLAAFDGDAMVATTGIFTRELTIPGGVLRIPGVTLVGVLPTHRRRGLLTQLMRRQLDDIHAAGEPIAALWASEAAIYGRFGYGAAARHASVTLRTAGARLAHGVPAPDGRVVLVEPAASVDRIAPLYDRVRRERIGHLDRTGVWWKRRTRDSERFRNGYGALRAALHENADGAVDGYALYAVKSGWDDGPDGRVRIRELVVDGPGAASAMWAFLLGLDLVRAVEWEIAPPDLPIAELVTSPQLPRLALGPNLWIRLVDVPAALAARMYAAPVDVVLDVEDAFCPWNVGRYRLAADGDGRATCERTDEPPDVALSATELGAAYLGGTRLTTLRMTGRVRELTPGALDRASVAFGAAREPWCPEIF